MMTPHMMTATENPAAMSLADAEAVRLDLEARRATERAALAADQAALDVEKETYTDGVARGAPVDQDAIEAQEAVIRRRTRALDALALALARHRPVWARAKVQALRDDARGHRAATAERQRAVDALTATITGLQQEVSEHVSVLQREALLAMQADAEADRLLRAEGLHMQAAR